MYIYISIYTYVYIYNIYIYIYIYKAYIYIYRYRHIYAYLYIHGWVVHSFAVTTTTFVPVYACPAPERRPLSLYNIYTYILYYISHIYIYFV